MKSCLKILVVLGILSTAIQAKAADTMKINLTYKHKLNEAGQTSGIKTIKQQFYSPENVFYREINYNETDGQVANYTFLFYRNGRLFTRECYNANDSLLYIMKYDYDLKGNETGMTKLVESGAGLITQERSIRTYNKDNKPVSYKKYIGKKIGTTTQYTYNASGQLTQEKTIHKQIAKADVKQEIRYYSHNDSVKTAKIIVNGKDNSGKPYQLSEEHIYNSQGMITAIKKFAADGSLTGMNVYKYMKSGAPSIYEEHDARGTIILLLEYDYKKHYMEMGTQVSKYENL